jgi:protoporphyrinogen/coproporphyrinogen III oxidase
MSVAVIGAGKSTAHKGIAGLSCAHYLSKLGLRVNLVEPLAPGGWIQTKRTPHLLELGPRTLRPAGINGSVVLDLVYELGLADDV